MIADQNFYDTCLTIFYPTASAMAYGQRPKFVRAKHSVTAEGENCAYGPTLVCIHFFLSGDSGFAEPDIFPGLETHPNFSNQKSGCRLKDQLYTLGRAKARYLHSQIMVIAVDITQYCFTPHCVAQVVVPHSSHPLLPIIILYTLRVTFLLLLVKRATFLQSKRGVEILG